MLVFLPERIDSQGGVWAISLEWGPDYTAYLRPGAMARKKKDQKNFLKNCRAKNIFVAIVEEVTEISAIGVEEDINEKKYNLTIHRATITSDEESQIISRWNRVNKISSIVDRVADITKQNHLLIRRKILFPHYENKIQNTEPETEDEDPFLSATISIEKLIESGQNSIEILKTYSISLIYEEKNVEFLDILAHALAITVKNIFVKRQVPHSKSIMIIMKGNISAIKEAAKATENISHPEEISKIQVKIQSSQKYLLETKCCPQYDQKADLYLEACYAAAISTLAIHISKNEDNPQILFEKIQEDPIERISIGLCGEVAHGKSTLIRSLTGEATQKHSSEHARHGATIRLGYSNCILIECNNCGSYSSHPEIESDLKCSYCNSINFNISKKVSFVDCPGHNELTKVMMSGANAFDAVIIVSAANEEKHKGFAPQAKSHISSLKALGLEKKLKNRTAIALTKSELAAGIASDENDDDKFFKYLKKQRDILEHDSNSTIAEKSPIFPLAAPKRLGLDAICAWMGNIQIDNQSSNTNSIMYGLRSFDCNKPGEKVENMKGGVIGGTIIQGSIKIGDIIEIRPGERIGPNTIKPLIGRVLEIKSGSTSLQIARKGGLVALGTNIDPIHFAANASAGSVIGTESLPPVFHTICCNDLEYVIFEEKQEDSDDEDDDKRRKKHIKLSNKDTKIRVYAGSANTYAKINRIKGDKLCVNFGERIAFEKKIDGVFKIVASAIVIDGDQYEILSDIPREYQKYEEHKIHEENHETDMEIPWFYDFNLLLNRFIDAFNLQKPSSKRIKIPTLEILQDGGTHVLWTNFKETCQVLNREPNMIISFIQNEAGFMCSIAGENKLRLKSRGRGIREKLTNILRAFAKSFIVCSQCRGAHTELIRGSTTEIKTSKLELVCQDCGGRRWIQN